MTRHSTAILISFALVTGCTAFDEDDTPPPPPPQALQQPAPAAPAAPAVPTTAAVDPAPAAAGLLGAYELEWLDHGPGRPRQVMPGALISTVPGCIWARWGWQFAADGGLTVSNEMLCSSPPDLGVGHGVCRAEMVTAVRWRQGGFRLPVPIRAASRFVNIRQSNRGTDTATVRCAVNVGAIDATLTDVVPGAGPSRPSEVTLLLADGSHMRLRAIETVEADHAAIIAAHGG